MSTTKKAAPKKAETKASTKAVPAVKTDSTASESKTETLKKETRKSLAKYNSDQLLSKLEKNGLIGISREVAIEILEERKVDVKKYKAGAWTAPKGSVKASKETPAEKAANVKDAKAAKPAKEKVVKEKKESNFVAIDESLEKVKKVLDNKDSKKSDKIRSFLKMGYSVLQISKVEALDARYQMVRQVSVALESVKETKEEAKK